MPRIRTTLATNNGSYQTVVKHGSTAGTARPTGAAQVLWVGTVSPTNAATDDVWLDDSTSPATQRRYTGSAFEALGGGGTFAPLSAATDRIVVTDSQYGLVCDGITDDFTAFQALVTANAGKQIYIPLNVKIFLSAPIVCPKNTILKGAATKRTQATDSALIWNHTGDGLQFTAANTVWPGQVEGISFQQQNASNAGCAINCTGAWRVDIQRCNFGRGTVSSDADNKWMVGIKLREALHNNIRDNHISLTGPAMACIWTALANTDDVSIRGNTLQLLGTTPNGIAHLVIDGAATIDIDENDGVGSGLLPWAYINNVHGLNCRGNDFEGTSSIVISNVQSQLSVNAGYNNSGICDTIMFEGNTIMPNIVLQRSAGTTVKRLITIGNAGAAGATGNLFTHLDYCTNFASILDDPGGAAFSDGTKAATSHFVVPVTGGVNAYHFDPLGLTGATTASRYVGATTGGAPVSGTFVTGDWVVDTAGPAIWICTAGGIPGTWGELGASTPPTGTNGQVTLSADVSVTAAQTNVVLTSASLPAGTYMVTGNLRIGGTTTTAAWCDATIVAGTATVSSGAPKAESFWCQTNNGGGGSVTSIVVITSPGTLTLNAYPQSGMTGTLTARKNSGGSGTDLTTSLCWVREA